MFLLSEQLAIANFRMEALQQERDLLAWDLEEAHSGECETLSEISFMLSQDESAVKKVNVVEAATEDTRQKLTDS